MIYLLGNPTLDRIRIGNRIVECFGGTVLYAGLFLARMGCAVALVGKGSRQQKRYLEQYGIETRHFTVTEAVTRFENRYVQAHRFQRARAGATIALKEVPRQAFAARAILAGPVLGELDPAILTAPRKSLLLIDMQGFLRHLDAGGNVYLKAGPVSEAVLAHADIVKLDRSEAEAVVGHFDDLQQAAERLHARGAACVLITCGGAGAFVSGASGRHWLAAPAVEVVDSTGAGDVFAAAFLMQYLESSGDVEKSGRFATAAAALATRAFGPGAIPGRQSITALLKQGPV